MERAEAGEWDGKGEEKKREGLALFSWQIQGYIAFKN